MAEIIKSDTCFPFKRIAVEGCLNWSGVLELPGEARVNVDITYLLENYGFAIKINDSELRDPAKFNALMSFMKSRAAKLTIKESGEEKKKSLPVKLADTTGESSYELAMDILESPPQNNREYVLYAKSIQLKAFFKREYDTAIRRGAREIKLLPIDLLPMDIQRYIARPSPEIIGLLLREKKNIFSGNEHVQTEEGNRELLNTFLRFMKARDKDVLHWLGNALYHTRRKAGGVDNIPVREAVTELFRWEDFFNPEEKIRFLTDLRESGFFAREAERIEQKRLAEEQKRLAEEEERRRAEEEAEERRIEEAQRLADEERAATIAEFADDYNEDTVFDTEYEPSETELETEDHVEGEYATYPAEGEPEVDTEYRTAGTRDVNLHGNLMMDEDGLEYDFLEEPEMTPMREAAKAAAAASHERRKKTPKKKINITRLQQLQARKENHIEGIVRIHPFYDRDGAVSKMFDIILGDVLDEENEVRKFCANNMENTRAMKIMFYTVVVDNIDDVKEIYRKTLNEMIRIKYPKSPEKYILDPRELESIWNRRHRQALEDAFLMAYDIFYADMWALLEQPFEKKFVAYLKDYRVPLASKKQATRAAKNIMDAALEDMFINELLIPAVKVCVPDILSCYRSSKSIFDKEADFINTVFGVGRGLVIIREPVAEELEKLRPGFMEDKLFIRIDLRDLYDRKNESNVYNTANLDNFIRQINTHKSKKMITEKIIYDDAFPWGVFRVLYEPMKEILAFFGGSSEKALALIKKGMLKRFVTEEIV